MPDDPYRFMFYDPREVIEDPPDGFSVHRCGRVVEQDEPHDCPQREEA